MEFKFIDVERAANILGVTTRTITKMIIVGRINAEAGNADMSAYREAYGEEGLRELLRMQAARRRSRHTD